MCLGVPGRVIAVNGYVATVDFFGVQKDVMLHIVDEPVSPGDYVLNHVGYAIRRIAPEEAEATLALYRDLLDKEDADLMAQDVRSEIAAGKSK